ncbi:MAG: alpha/beta hydrolase [Acidimicrobiia bacterium]|nr:dienelactone hydrolase family protein [Acidimicrobiia bacterium]NNF09880.1 alpha/beta hydrolase [Acidimicrobiia bacterium]NNL70507.1 alpha/beta hydrolase [Acidimicrobiia bacterium]
MIERVSIDWEDGTVTGRLAQGDGEVGVLLAHGAGAGQDHEWMTYVRDGLARAGHPVLTFNYPYAEAGRRAPNPARILLACHRAALAFFASRVERVVLAGKSMGGRMGSHVAAEGAEVAGVVFYGYPLVGIGKTEPRDVSHLADVKAPLLFVQGTRDRLAPLDLIRPVVDGLPGADLHVVEDGDHSFKVPKRTGRDVWEVLDEVVAVTGQWLAGI